MSFGLKGLALASAFGIAILVSGCNTEEAPPVSTPPAAPATPDDSAAPAPGDDATPAEATPAEAPDLDAEPAAE